MMKTKSHLLEKVIIDVEARLQALVKSAKEAHDAATNEESKAENKYDTRGLEASYLAGAQSRRVMELEESLFYLKKVKPEELEQKSSAELFTIVQVSDDDGEEKNFFILPVQGGVVVEHAQAKFQIITLSSPIGKAVYKKSIGDEFKFKNNYFEILNIT